MEPLSNREKSSGVTIDESARLEIVRGSGLLNSRREERFDRLTRLAAMALDAPMAAITLVDAQRVWFKSVFGALEVREVPRKGFFCDAAIGGTQSGPLIVRNAAKDRRFAAHPLVMSQGGIRFYVGRPLVLNGMRVAHFA
jgi:GAF domain-containing protein